MFGKGRNHNSDINSKDIERMMQALDNIIAGDFDKVDVSEYDNQMYGKTHQRDTLFIQQHQDFALCR